MMEQATKEKLMQELNNEACKAKLQGKESEFFRILSLEIENAKLRQQLNKSNDTNTNF